MVCLYYFKYLVNVSVQVFNSDNFLPALFMALVHRDITLISSKAFSLNAIKIVTEAIAWDRQIFFFCQNYVNKAFIFYTRTSFHNAIKTKIKYKRDLSLHRMKEKT